MPMFEYKCSKGHITERLELSSKNESEIVCPALDCRELAVKQISRTSWGYKKPDTGIRTYDPSNKWA